VSDRDLGMRRPITRRDFVQGAVAGGAALALGCAPELEAPAPGPVGAAATGPLDPSRYPPARHGMRGSHPGSFETAHQLALEHRQDWDPIAESDEDVYDLVVVGSGVSGLAAAHFYGDQEPGAKVLLLENHDDFGGHARRNEFQVGGRTVLGYGGSQSLENPGDYSSEAKQLLSDIGVEPARLADAYDNDFYLRNELAAGLYFDAATYGVDRLLRTDFLDASRFLAIARSELAGAEAVEQMPFSEAARRELVGLLQLSEDRLPEEAIWSEPGFLRGLSYRDFLTQHLGVTQPEVLAFLQNLPSGYFGHGIDCIPALDAMLFGLPGIEGTSLGSFSGLIGRAINLAVEPYTYHFPDGNSSVARLLVRKLIPAVGEGSTMHDVVLDTFDYSALDRRGSPVRLRLSSTVVRVQHEGPAASAGSVTVTYVRGGRSEQVRARNVVLACYNSVIPYLCPELPEPQKLALKSLVKSPLVYTNVLLGSWQAWRDAGVGMVFNPGSWHQMAMLDFPVSFPGYAFASDPSQPIVVHMSRVPTTPGKTPQEQSRLGRFELLQTPFEQIEREIRLHLAGMLGPHGFDPARDIEAIVVNRWPHGYAFEPNPLFDPVTSAGEAPHEVGRKRFGRITIANSDAGARAYLDCAIDQASRAVQELAELGA
jgi:spermidine dehydrogenase